MTPLTTKSTMADELNINSDKDAIYQRTLYLSTNGCNLKDACDIIEEETGQHWNTTRQQYFRRGGSLGSPKKKKHGNCSLTEEQERILLSVATVYSIMHEGLTLNGLRKQVKNIFDVNVGYKWARNFEKRNKDEMKMKKTKLLASKRVDKTIPENVVEFICQVETINEFYPMSSSTVMNYDETRVFIGMDGEIGMEHISKERAQKRGFKGKTIGSLVSFVVANGQVLMSVWIFKGNENNEQPGEDSLMSEFYIADEKRNLRGNWPRFYAFTKSGYSNKKLHGSIMEKFGEVWNSYDNNQHCWLFGDQLGCHKCPQMVQRALANRVMCWLLPANTSHFLQPLDDLIFGRFKQVLKTAGKKIPFSHTLNRYELNAALYEAGYRAEQDAFTPRVIIRAFERTGVWPFNPQNFLEKTRQNVGLETSKQSKAMYVQAMRRSVEGMIEAKGKKPTIKQGSVRIQASKLFSPFELLQAEHLSVLEQQNKERKRKMAAEVKREESAAKRAAKTCGSLDCSKVTRKEGGAKNWNQCGGCLILFCPNHKDIYQKHISTCELGAMEATVTQTAEI